MIWIFLLCAGLALVFAQLGAMSVWMVIMKAGLLAALLVIAVLVATLLWRRVSGRQ